MTHTPYSIPRPPLRGAGEARFYEAAESYLDASLNLNPDAASYSGYHKYDRELDDLSSAGIRARVAFYENSERGFAAMDRSKMSIGALIDLDLILNDIRASLFSLRELKPHENDPSHYNELIGYGTLFLTILDDDDPAWGDRLSALLSRMEAIPSLLSQARDNLNAPARLITELIILQNPANILFFRDTIPKLCRRVPNLASRLQSESKRVIAALEDYQRFLTMELLPRSTGNWRLGRELWTRKLRLTLQSDLEPEDIVDRAWKRLKSEREAMLRIAAPIHDRLFPAH